MNSDRTYREDNCTSGATTVFHDGRNNHDAGNNPLDAIVELAELVRDLHQSLESYAPMWYSDKMDDRIRETLAAADWAYQALTDRR